MTGTAEHGSFSEQLILAGKMKMMNTCRLRKKTAFAVRYLIILRIMTVNVNCLYSRILKYHYTASEEYSRYIAI